MDNYDLKIVQELQSDGRLPWVELAERVNLSPSACQRRVAALRERGVITAFTARIDPRALGFDVEAFVAVRIERQNMAYAQAFREAVALLPEIQACHMLSGTDDFMLQVIATDLRAFGAFMQREILSLPGVKDATSSIVLEQIKDRPAVPTTGLAHP
jgi:Lrp/AsnC family leucine-responsive transcriptional regulator